MTIHKARQIAARIWCDPEMCNLTMDVDAAEEIAQIILKVVNDQQPSKGVPDDV